MIYHIAHEYQSSPTWYPFALSEPMKCDKTMNTPKNQLSIKITTASQPGSDPTNQSKVIMSHWVKVEYESAEDTRFIQKKGGTNQW